MGDGWAGHATGGAAKAAAPGGAQSGGILTVTSWPVVRRTTYESVDAMAMTVPE